MVDSKIPRWHQCGIFSIRALWPFLFVVMVHGQHLPNLAVRLPTPTPTPASLHSPTADLTILALRVAFAPDEDLSTTGNGQFLEEIQTQRCEGFLVDPPPHGARYFHAQLEAVTNYFQQVSRGYVSFNLAGSYIYPPEGDEPLVVGEMADYSSVADPDSSDARLVQLFAESLQATADSGVNVLAYDIAVVFHAGLGQDFAYPSLDPTPSDIPSAYIDLNMIEAALGTDGIPLPPDDALFRNPCLLLPEGQNHIYYDIVEDIFFGLTDYCDVQIGLTGTFALLMGYALGLPPLFDTDEGIPGVGIFGLMDVGSNNGQGVIPAPPTAWTRAYMGWEDPMELYGDIAQTARHLAGGQTDRVTLNTDEYFLVENRLNWVLPGVGLDDLRYRNRVVNAQDNSYTLPYYFDYLRDSVGVTVDPETGVVTSIPNYDIGLPGSGLLIWHVDKSRYSETMQGINNDPEARAVSLVEADGAVDLGFPTSALFGSPDQGWLWDMWYAGNEAFFHANPGRGGADNPDLLLSFDRDTRPSTHLNSGAESRIAFSDIGLAGDSLTFTVADEADVTRLPERAELRGFNGIDWIYYTIIEGSGWWVLGEQQIGESESPAGLILSEHDAVEGQRSNAFWIIEQIRAGYSARRFDAEGTLSIEIIDSVRCTEAYFNNGKLHMGIFDSTFSTPPDSEHIAYYHSRSLPAEARWDNQWGYLWDATEYAEVIRTRYDGYAYDSLTAVLWDPTDDVSLGDLDGDGLDEIVAISPGWMYSMGELQELVAVDANGTVLDGFPVAGQFENPLLIANLRDDIRPELVVVESGDITIYSPEGEELERLGLHTDTVMPFLLHFPDGRVGLANGDRLHWFEPEEQNPQWTTGGGRFSGNRYSLNDGSIRVTQPAVLDKSRVYNYPNPVTEGRTTIRFYTGSATRADIRIYTVDGLLVVKEELTNLAMNDYNEWIWVTEDIPSGLYYGIVDVKGAETSSALVKIAVVR